MARAHLDAENAHDLAAIVETFAEHAILQVNDEMNGTTREDIAASHAFFGFSGEPGVFTDLQTITEREHFADDAIIFEGHFRGIHTGDAPGYPPATGRDVELPYIVAYRFDPDGKIVSERARVDFSPIYRDSAAKEAP